MTSAVSLFGHRSEFDSFLYAPVGEERNGMLLSVLSALARLDMDPWLEAATLTKMPAQDATLRLTSLLSSLPSDAASLLAPSTVLRLIALLPKEPLRDRRPCEASVSVTARYWMVALYFLVAFVLMFAEQFAEDRHTPVSTEAGPAAHSTETAPSPQRGPNPIAGPVTSQPQSIQGPGRALLDERRTRRGAVVGWGGANRRSGDGSQT